MVTVKLTNRRYAYLLCGALEGGSNYWYDAVESHLTDGVTPHDAKAQEQALGLDMYGNLIYVAPFLDGGSVTVRVDGYDGSVQPITLASMKAGMQRMADKYPKHFADVVAGNADATTADVFLQLTVFGEIVFG